MEDVGVVAIGRNEGERLMRCLASVVGQCAAVVYVDSGSTDDSVARAAAMGAEVVALNTSIPFTAARARNEGYARLRAMKPDIAFVQFVDGDCEVAAGWLAAGREALLASPRTAATCGRRRERHRDATIYNRLIDMDWAGEAGEVDFAGGDVMMRVAAFEQVGGYRAPMICCEDPEICVRLRSVGWKIVRLDREMTIHDAAMSRFGQWWKRMVRGGFAFALGRSIHRDAPGKPWARDVRRIWMWGVVLPLASGVGAWPTGGWSLLLLLGYPMWAWKVSRYRRRAHGDSRADAWLYGVFCMIGKFPEAAGMLSFHLDRLLGRQRGLIEYK